MSAQPIDLNILPERYRPRRFSLGRTLFVLAAAAVILGLIPAYLAEQSARDETAAMQTQVDQARLTLEQAQAAQAELEAEIERVGQQIELTQAELERLQVELDGLRQRQTPETAVGIRAIVETLVPRVRLTSVTQIGQNFQVSGAAGSQALVLDYARAFEATGQFANVRIISIENKDPSGVAPDVKFVISLER